MILGSVFYEKHLSTATAEQHLDWLLTQPVAHLEFTLHEKLFDMALLQSLVFKARSRNVKISYHSPDFIDRQNYNLFGLSQPLHKTETLRYFEKLINGLNQDSTHFVFHGLSHQDYFDVNTAQPTAVQLEAFNYKAIDRILTWLHQEGLPLKLSFENTAPQDALGFGQTSESLIKLSHSFKDSHFGFCIDLSHLWRASKYFGFSAQDFMTLAHQSQLDISQFHLHGFSTNLTASHIALNETHDDFLIFVKGVDSKKIKKTFVLECFFSETAKNLEAYESLLLQDFKLF